MRTGIVLLTLVVVGIFATACASQPPTDAQQNNNPQQYGNAPPGTQGPGAGYYNNLTPEQRQQLMATMLQQATAACNGLSENDSCTIASSRGNRTGTCQVQNSTLLCRTMRQRQTQ